MLALGRIAAWGFSVGLVCFLLGFVGPIIVTPDANQGPLLGIFITGPLGTLAGFAIGVIRELMGRHTGPFEVLAAHRAEALQLGRIAAGTLGVLLLLYGTSAMVQGADRPAASSVVVAIVLLWFSARGAVPAWFRR